MDKFLSNKRVLITGGSRGIGESAVRLMSDLGAKVAFTFHSQARAAEELAKKTRCSGNEAIFFQADQCSREDAKKVVDALVAQWGGIDAFVGNAGVWLPTPLDLPNEDNLEKVMETNLMGLFRWHAELVPVLTKAGNGSIVLIASTAGQRGEAGYGAYAASKGAIISLTKSMAAELGPYGIRVNCVAPGWVDTDLSAPALRQNPDTRKAIEGLFPLGRIPVADDIAGPIAFLLSDWSSAITGEILNVNGGTVLCG
ncbi:MAG: SDR family oxidoreductase [Holophagales bacterium]|jgi:3-oxoacyl-[acyl-carrier protein] reductase|nr:SDR family oxidoreductase [Holophagales bacterium]